MLLLRSSLAYVEFFRGLEFSVCVRGRAPCGVLVLVESKKKVEVTVLVIQSMYSM